MSITIELPADIENALRQRAAAAGEALCESGAKAMLQFGLEIGVEGRAGGN